MPPLTVLVLVVVSLFTTPALAESARAPTPGDLATLPAADLTPEPDAEAPALRIPEYARRRVELTTGGELGLAGVPLLAHADPTPAWLVGVGWRAAPWFTLGVQATLESSTGLERGWLALTGRAYFSSRGSVEPYALWSIGAGSLERHDAARTERGSGWLLRAGFGIDFFVADSLRLGPSLHYTRAMWGETTLCSPGGCVVSRGDRVALPAGFASAALSLTWVVGAPY
jgi:hypothetical protein